MTVKLIFIDDSLTVNTWSDKAVRVIKERRLRWSEHVLSVEDDRIPKQAIYLQVLHTQPSEKLGNWNLISSIVKT